MNSFETFILEIAKKYCPNDCGGSGFDVKNWLESGNISQNDWDLIEKEWIKAEILNSSPLLIANGDILDKKMGEKLCQECGFDGYMIGRGVFKNPFAFGEGWELGGETGEIKNTKSIPNRIFTPLDRLDLLQEHIVLWEKAWGGGDKNIQDMKNYSVLKKYFKIYISGFPGAVPIRTGFMETKTTKEALDLIEITKIELNSIRT